MLRFISSLVRCEICINTRRRCKLHFHTMTSFTLSECSSQLGARSQQIRVGAASHVARWRTMRTRVKFWRNSKWTDQSDQSAKLPRRKEESQGVHTLCHERIYPCVYCCCTDYWVWCRWESKYPCMRWAKYICRWIMALKCVLWQCVEVESGSCSSVTIVVK